MKKDTDEGGRAIGRYVLVRALAEREGERRWLAYDPTLDRPVVVRVLDDQSAARLAALRAAARLHHPAVVPIFDVGREPAGLFAAMGHVEGRPLAAWRQERERGWREVVDVFLQAGQALLAAHAQGLVHGAFAAEQLSLGWDGHVYLHGFGDALGGSADDDRRAFASALHLALNEPPQGAPPAFVRRALREALGESPAARPLSLRALLQQLARDPAAARHRRMLFGTGAATLAAATALFFALRSPAPCGGAAERLSGVWDASLGAAVQEAFVRTGKPESRRAWQVIEERLGAYARDWAAAHTDACLAHDRGEQSSADLDLRMTCLGERRQELGALASVLREADAAVMRKSVEAAAAMTPISRCADVAALALGPQAPAEPQARARLEALGAALARARALQRAGRYPAALKEARTVETQAREGRFGPLQAEAATLIGALEERSRRSRPAEEALERGAFAGLAAGHDRAVAEAAATLVSLEYQSRTRLEQSDWWAARARAALERSGAAPELESALERRVGDLAAQRGQLTEALGHFERSLALIPAENGPARAVAEDRMGRIFRKLERPAEALVHHRRALQLFEAALGPHHPNVAIALHAVALALRGTGQLRDAVAYHERALALQRATLGPGHVDAAGMENAFAITLSLLGDAEGARTRFAAALETYQRRFGPKHTVVASLLGNLANVLSRLGRDAEAVETAARALALCTELHGAQDPETANALNGLAACQRRLEPQRALETIGRALAIHRATATQQSGDLATALGAQGRLLLELGRHAEAQTVLAEAVRLSPQMDRTQVILLTDLGQALAALGRQAEAETLLTRAVEHARTTEGDPRDAGRAYLALARTLWRRPQARAQAQSLASEARAAFAAAPAGSRSAQSEMGEWPPR